MRLLPGTQSRCAALTLAAISATVASRCALASTFNATWKPNTTGSWNVGANWSTNPNFPNNTVNDTYNARIDDPNANVTLNVPITINTGTLANGSLLGAGTLNANSFLWSGGNVNGTGVINVATTTFLQGNTKSLHGFTFNFANTCVTDWTTGGIVSIEPEGGVFNNAGTFNDATDAGWFWNTTQTPVFNNLAGATYVKLTGTDGADKQVWARFNNAGTVTVNSAELWLAGGGTSSGTFNVVANRTLLFSDFNELFAAAGATITTLTSSSVVSSDGTVTFENSFGDANTDVFGKLDSAFTVVNAGLTGQVRFNSGSRFDKSSVGDLIVKSGTLSLNTGQSSGVVVKNLKLSGGEIAGADARHVQDSFEWTGGALSGPSSTEAQVSLTIDFGATKLLVNHVLINRGSASWVDGPIELNNSQIENAVGATWVASSDDAVSNADTSTASTFHNAGMFRKSAGFGGVASTDFQQVAFNNDGTVQLQAGNLRLGGGGTHNGTFTLSANTTLKLADATFGGGNYHPHIFNSGATINGLGAALEVAGATTFSAGSSATVSALTVTSNLVNNGTLNSSNATISLGGSARLPAGTWNNSGTLTVGGQGAASLNVQPGGALTSGVAIIGDSNTANGTATLDGAGLLWDIGGVSTIGNNGFGTLLVQNGAHVHGTGTASLGAAASGRGFARVSGAGSRWDLTAPIDVAPLGNATTTITGAGVLTSTDGFVGRISGGVGTVIVSSAVAVPGSRWDMTGALYVAGGSTLAASGGAAGIVILNSGGTLTAPSLTRVWNNGTFLYNGGTLVTGAIDLFGGGRMLLASGTDKFVNTGTLTIDTANSSVLDLNECDARLTATAKASVENYTRTARNGGVWNAGGITSTAARLNGATGLGVLSGTEYIALGNASFDGVAIAPTDVLVKYTWNGDANFDGRVTFDDYVKIDTGFNTHLAGWLNGDFDYSGAVNFDDYVLIDIAFNQQNGTLSRAVDWISGDDRSGSGRTATGVQIALEHFEQFGADYARAFLGAVPEPSALMIAGVQALACTVRARLRRNRARNLRLSLTGRATRR